MKRLVFIDWAKVICMFLVIYGHYIPCLKLNMGNNAIWHSVHFINLFHMPFFFIISGILFSTKPLKIFIKKDINRIIIPYFIMCLACLLVGLLYSIVRNWPINLSTIISNVLGIVSASDLYGKGSMDFSGPLWFVYSLFIARLLMNTVQNHNRSLIYFIIITLGGLYCGNRLPFRLDSSCICFSFFYIGYKFKDTFRKFEEISIPMSLLLACASLIVLILIMDTSDNIYSRQVLSINVCYYGRYPILFLLSGIAGTVMILSISRLLQEIKSKIVSEMSNGMIIILGFQQLIYTFGIGLIKTYNPLIAIFISFIVLFCCYFIIIIAQKYTPSMLGHRKI